jgi:hypothetical protein
MQILQDGMKPVCFSHTRQWAYYFIFWSLLAKGIHRPYRQTLNSCNLVIHTNANLRFKMPAVSFELITDDIPFAHGCSVCTENWENYTKFIAVISTYYSQAQFYLIWHFLCQE